MWTKIFEISLTILILCTGVLMIYAGIKYSTVIPVLIGVLACFLGLVRVMTHLIKR